MLKTKYYILIVTGGTELESVGPYDTEEELEHAAKKFWAECSEQENFFPVHIDEDGKLCVGVFVDGELDEPPSHIDIQVFCAESRTSSSILNGIVVNENSKNWIVSAYSNDMSKSELEQLGESEDFKEDKDRALRCAETWAEGYIKDVTDTVVIFVNGSEHKVFRKK